MSKTPGSAASPERSWLKLYAAVAAAPLALAACGGGGGGGSPAPVPTPAPTPVPTPSPAPSASLTVTPSATVATPSGTPITLTAVVVNSTASPTWSLSGPGTLSATSGAVVTYTPPATGAISANATAIVSAALTGATTQNVSITINVTGIAGLTWTTVTAPPVGNLLGVDYAAGQFVAVSDQGGGLASVDAATWTPVTVLTSNVATDHLKAYAIGHLAGTYVAVGATSSAPYATSTGAVASSTDGTTWTMGALPAGATPVHGLIVGTRVVGLGEAGHLYASSNGTAWSALTTVTGPATLNAGAYGAGKYVAVGDGGWIAASNDSTAWEAGQVVKVGGAGVNMHGIAWTGTQFVAVGDGGAITTSANGSAWSALHTSALTGALRAVAVSGDGIIVVVGDNGIETSSDGVNWTARNDSGVAALDGVTLANGTFVAVGASSAIKTSAPH
jgi:hypothetical protein